VESGAKSGHFGLLTRDHVIRIAYNGTVLDALETVPICG
jgi:hypothetical protein